MLNITLDLFIIGNLNQQDYIRVEELFCKRFQAKFVKLLYTNLKVLFLSTFFDLKKVFEG